MIKKLIDSRRGRTAFDYTIAIIYDGERTEDEYFRGWQQILPATRLTLLPYFVRSGGNVLRAVREARKIQKETPDCAEFWCVCDVDDTNNSDLANAIQISTKYGIRLCVSRRCFEIWIAMHFGFSSRPILNEEDAINLVKQHINAYGDRDKSINFFDLFPSTDDAIRNCESLRKLELENPSTDVDRIVKKLMQNLS